MVDSKNDVAPESDSKDKQNSPDLRRENGPDVFSDKTKEQVYREAQGVNDDSNHSHDVPKHSEFKNAKGKAHSEQVKEAFKVIEGGDAPAKTENGEESGVKTTKDSKK